MKIKCNWSHIDLGWRSGEIFSMCDEAITIACVTSTKVSFEFNGIKVNVTGESNTDSVARKALEAVKSKETAVFGEGW